MDNSLKGLILAAGTIITCIVIGLGFYIAREARDTAASGAGQISKLNAEFNESDKVMYEGLEVSGSEVVNVINKFKNDDLSVKVVTNKATNYYIQTMTATEAELTGSSGASIQNAQKSGHSQYINPNAQFLGAVIRDVNNAIIALSFKQVN